MPRQFVACRFRPTDARQFTYHYDGEEPLAAGDMVKVPDRSGDGWKRVEVVSISDEPPPFPTKPILGHFDPAPEDELEDAAPANTSAADPLDAEMPF